MSASDEFPRGWYIPGSAPTNVDAVITIPAVPGFAHILTDWAVMLLSYNAAEVGTQITVNGIALGQIYLPPASGTAYATGTDSDSGLQIAGAIGAAMVFKVAQINAGNISCRIRGYDI
jgi:hypothetical protein